jgi:hypothetical protein
LSASDDVENLKGFAELLILDEQGNIEYRSAKSTKQQQTVLSGYLASAFTIADSTCMGFIGNTAEVSFDGESGSVLVMKGSGRYFFLILEGAPSMGIARLKLRDLVDSYA